MSRSNQHSYVHRQGGRGPDARVYSCSTVTTPVTSMMHRTQLLLILLFSTTVLLVACGQKGDLYLPADDARTTLITDDGH